MPDIGLSDPVLWFLLGAFLVVGEFFLPGVVIVFFGLAAWLVSATTAFGWTTSTTSQVLLFSIASLVLLFTLRGLVKSWFMGETEVTTGELDEYLGREALALEDLRSDEPGQIEFKGAVWRGIPNESLPKGTRLTIARRDGLTLHVTKLISS